MFDKFLWDYYCSWHKKKENNKKINPTLKYCSCGYPIHFNKFHKIKMIISDTYEYKCPKCGNKSIFTLINYVVKREEKKQKKNTEIWRNG